MTLATSTMLHAVVPRPCRGEALCAAELPLLDQAEHEQGGERDAGETRGGSAGGGDGAVSTGLTGVRSDAAMTSADAASARLSGMPSRAVMATSGSTTQASATGAAQCMRAFALRSTGSGAQVKPAAAAPS